MRRIAALVVAVGLIVVALVIRNNRDEEKRLGPYRLTCATEFANACRSLPASEVAVTIEPAGVTTDRLIGLPAGADLGFDGWVSAGRWAGIVADIRKANGLAPITDRTSVVGHTRITLVGWRDRLGVIRQACGGTITWRCVGDVAARASWKANKGPESWGNVKIALADPVSETAGLVGLAAGTAGFDPNLTSGAADPAQNDAYLHWLSGLAKAIPRPVPSIDAMLTARGVVDLYVGLEAEVTGILGTAANKAEFEVVYLSPVFDIDARIASPTRKVPPAVREAVRTAGWAADKESAASPLPPNSVLAALRQLWKDTV